VGSLHSTTQYTSSRFLEAKFTTTTGIFPVGQEEQGNGSETETISLWFEKIAPGCFESTCWKSLIFVDWSKSSWTHVCSLETVW
jgi:hypothetical protein